MLKIGLGPNFKLPPERSQDQLIFLVLVFLDLIEASDGMWYLTSWWRSPQENARVGGVGTSLHMRGLAMDLVGPQSVIPGDVLGTRYRAVSSRWRQYGAPFQSVTESDHIHLEVDPAETRPRGLIYRLSD